MKVLYPGSYMTETDAKMRIAPVDLESVSDTVGIEVPEQRRSYAISPHYAVGVTADSRTLVFGVLDYCADQQGCGGAAYGDIVAPARTASGEAVTWFLAVVEVQSGGDWRREVWVIEDNRVVDVKRAPVILEVQDSNGNVAYVPIGNPLAGIGVAEILKWAGIIGGTIAGWKLFDWLSNREKRKMVEDVVEAAKDNPEIVRLVLHPVAGEAVDASNGSLLGKLKEYIIGGALAIGSIIMLIFKWQLILELFRSLFRRR